MNDRKLWQPVPVSPIEVMNLEMKYPGLKVVDQYKNNLEELFLLRNPKYRFDKNHQNDFEKFYAGHTGNDSNGAGNWFYYSWLNTAVHFLSDDMHQELRTGRNRYLISKDEQEIFYNATIAVLGMSVGSHVAIMIALTGGARHIKIADPDSISGDNLNRIRGSSVQVGINKAIVVARQIYELNPYAEVEVYTDGVNENNAENILNGTDLLCEEMDHPYWKLKIRELAKKRKIPVIMGTDNGDGAIIDIERYDIKQSYPMLHGLICSLTPEKIKCMNPKDWPGVAAKIAGANFAVPRMLDSVVEVGKTLYSWPQLGTAANLCGTVLAYLARRIIIKSPNIKSGRYVVSLDSIFESDYKRNWFPRKIAFFKFIRKMTKHKL